MRRPGRTPTSCVVWVAFLRQRHAKVGADTPQGTIRRVDSRTSGDRGEEDLHVSPTNASAAKGVKVLGKPDPRRSSPPHVRTRSWDRKATNRGSRFRRWFAPNGALSRARMRCFPAERGQASACLPGQQSSEALLDERRLGDPGVSLLNLRQKGLVHVERHTNGMHPTILTMRTPGSKRCPTRAIPWRRPIPSCHTKENRPLLRGGGWFVVSA